MTRKHGRAPLIMREDLANGALDAVLATASFSLALGFHPIVPIVAFVDGMLGRHWSRMRWNIAMNGGDNVKSNAAALLTHAAIGTAKMGLFLNPLGGFGVPMRSILRVSMANSLSKGTFRLVFDKAFGRHGERHRAIGVAYASLLTFGQGLLCGMAYKGSSVATVLQFAFAATGIGLMLYPYARRMHAHWTAPNGPMVPDYDPIEPSYLDRSSQTRLDTPELVA